MIRDDEAELIRNRNRARELRCRPQAFERADGRAVVVRCPICGFRDEDRIGPQTTRKRNAWLVERMLAEHDRRAVERREKSCGGPGR